MRCAILLTVIGVAFAASVPKQAHQRIVGGRPTTVNKYPFVAHTQNLYGNVWIPWCGGSILTNTAVLSAAHCFEDDLPARSYRVRLGSSFSTSGGTIFNLASYLNHPYYENINMEYDVTILKLATPIIFNDVMRSARIPSSLFPIADGTKLTALGWGALYYDGPSPEVLHDVEVNKINHTICAERYRYLQTILPGQYPDVPEDMLCTGILDVGGKDTCNGDSGGPVVLNDDIVVGITSWGHECAEPMYPGIKVRVSFVSNWIVENA